MRDRIFKGFIYSLILFALLLLAMGFYADFGALVSAFKSYSVGVIFAVVSFSLFNYATRFLRWQYYLRETKVKVSGKTSAFTFFSGLLMSVTPGKAGEIFKSLILKEAEEIPISTTAPIVFAERLTDLIAVIILAVAFSYGMKVDYRVIALAVIMVLVIFFLIFSKKAHEVARKIFTKYGKFEILIETFDNLLSGVKALLGYKPLIAGTVFAICAWMFEAFGFFLLLKTVSQKAELSVSVFIYTVSTLAGAISMLPGGLVFTEATMSSLLISTGLRKEFSIAATVLIRALTLWFGALLGLAIFLLFRKRFLKRGEIA